MAMMTLGLFVFDLPSLTYQQLQRRTTWRHAFSDRVGARPLGQFVGEGDDDITLTGMLLMGDVTVYGSEHISLADRIKGNF